MVVVQALVLYGLLAVVLISVEILFTYATRGFGFGFSANRPEVEKSGLALRIQRTYRNHVEAGSYIVPILAAAAFLGLETPGVEFAAHLIIIGRLGFAVTYYTGISFIRVPFFVLGSVPSLYIGFIALAQLMA